MMIGTTLGPYSVLSKLGVGGMGEVYRARDERLGRDVAIKILPAAFRSDPDRLARFEREARSLAALNHPNIAAIYGVEEQPGITALILELVEGETLADRLSGQLTLAEALELAKQIAEALYAKFVNSGAPEELLLRTSYPKSPTDVSADSRFLLYSERDATSSDLWYLPLTGDRTPQRFLLSPYEETAAQFSPDGRWVAYQSNSTGHFEIYAQPFPGPGDRIPVSSGSGQQVRWSRSELFYVGADHHMHAVPFTSLNGRLQLGTPVTMFPTPFDDSNQFRQQYAVTADGQRFLMNNPTGTFEPPSITMILNWHTRH